VQIEKLLNTDLVTLEQDRKKFIGNHHNTYVFTKDLAERYLERYSGNLRVVINRPSMIQGTHSDPFPGWTDSVGAHASVAFADLLGVNHNNMMHQKPLDIVPADFVSNSVLITSAYAGNQQNPGFWVFHNTSAINNEVDVKTFWDDFNRMSKFMPAETALGDPGVISFHNRKYFDFRNYTDYDLPIKILDKVSKLPLVGSKKM
jgi:hypothetical protein